VKRHIALLFLVNFTWILSSMTHADEAVNRTIQQHWQLSLTQQNYLNEGKFLATAEVESFKKNNENLQKFLFKTSALNNKSCDRVLDFLSRYEDFRLHLDFIKESKYDDISNYVSFVIDSPVLPFPMRLNFKIPRVKKPGEYSFEFEHGFLKGLKGVIHIHSVSNKCLIYSESFWQGQDTKIPDFVIEMFSETLTRIAFEKLFRAIH
jgi:hypothetical protein